MSKPQNRKSSPDVSKKGAAQRNGAAEEAHSEHVASSVERTASSVDRAAPDAASAKAPKQKLFGTVEIPFSLSTVVAFLIRALILVYSAWNSYRIRTYALRKYGNVIHEFDPWFNYRATQYLSKHGWYAFFHWFDYQSWYPLGRPVGTTIYPGMQITAVALHRLLKLVGYPMKLNDVCCFMPCWFGASASLFLGLLTYECSGSANAGVIGSLIMGIIPAHIMRSVGGGYDNESIAMTAMMMTFYFWVRSLRPGSSFIWGVLTGCAYGYMVATWGGYVFVLNMIGVHAAALILIDWAKGQYSKTLYKQYCIFYIVGTAIATRVPVVGYTPFKSLEQMGPLLLLIFLNALEFSEYVRRKKGYEIWSKKGVSNRLQVLAATGGLLVLLAAVMWPTGYFGPLSSRVRGLFVKHTRTGNPLTDSVAEHQPASREAYWHHLHYCMYLAQLGFLLIFVNVKRWRSGSFLSMYGFVAYFFSHKMARLLILAGPVASALAGVTLGFMLDFAFNQFWWGESEIADVTAEMPKDGKRARTPLLEQLRILWNKIRLFRLALAFFIILFPFVRTNEWRNFVKHCEEQAENFSHPQIMFETNLNNGQRVIIDDYRQAYFWLKKHTPEDSRVMAWWDYGYQITGIANRTTIADGNTWNHEHIATLGKCLTSPVKEAHKLIRHISDYVLIWGGGHSDDLAKSPHMARIGNSVYRDICPNDPLCSHFGFEGSRGNPTPMMRKSLLYNLHSHKVVPGVEVDEKLFKEVHTSRYGLVRIFQVMNVSQESKDWLADPKNRICDAPGSWYCVGQYPKVPVWQKLLEKRREFGQLEDFNKKKADDAYHREYMNRFRNQEGGE